MYDTYNIYSTVRVHTLVLLLYSLMLYSLLLYSLLLYSLLLYSLRHHTRLIKSRTQTVCKGQWAKHTL
jgi:hypothetical protein